MEKKLELIEMINRITDEDLIEYLYVLTKDVSPETETE